jgi:Uma2 family endonuclease
MPVLDKSVHMPEEPVRRVTVAEYHRMIKAAVFQDDESFELLEGLLVPKMPRSPPHDLACGLVEREIEERLPAEWVRRAKSGMTTADSEPEPHLTVVRGPHRRYKEAHPRHQDTAMVIEVSEASLRRDRTLKQRIYARAKIPVYWIVNLLDMQIEVYTEPTGRSNARYLQRKDYKANESVPLVIDGQEIDQIPVRDLLP